MTDSSGCCLIVDCSGQVKFVFFFFYLVSFFIAQTIQHQSFIVNIITFEGIIKSWANSDTHTHTQTQKIGSTNYSTLLFLDTQERPEVALSKLR